MGKNSVSLEGKGGGLDKPSDWTVQSNRLKGRYDVSKKTPIQTKENLLSAAAKLITMHGASHLTLERVALEANVSKGGLLHHFPTKLELLAGLVGQLALEFEADINQHLETEPEGRAGRWARAYIRATFSTALDEAALTNALAQIINTQPELLEPIKKSFEFAATQILSDGLPAPRATAIRMACDGLWFAETTGMSDLTPQLRAALQEELISWTR